MEQDGLDLPLIFAGILVFGAVCDGMAALFFYQKSKNKYADYVKTRGTVVKFDVVPSSRGDLLYPTIKFDIGGKAREVRSPMGRSHWSVNAGDEVDVIYNMSDPNQAEIDSPFHRFMLAAMCATGAVMALLTAAIVYVVMTTTGGDGV